MVYPIRDVGVADAGTNFLAIGLRNVRLRQAWFGNNTTYVSGYLYLVPPISTRGKESESEPAEAISLKDRQPPYRKARTTLWHGDLRIPDEGNWFVEVELFNCSDSDDIILMVLVEDV